MTANYSPAQLAQELAIVARRGVGRPLYGTATEADIATLVALAAEITGNSELSVLRLVASAVRMGIDRLFPTNRQQAAAVLLGVDLDCNIDNQEYTDSTLSSRRVKAAGLLGISLSSYEREPSKYELPLYGELANLLLLLIPKAQPPSPLGPWASDYVHVRPALRQDLSTDAEVVKSLRSYAQQATSLYYQLLIGLFVERLDSWVSHVSLTSGKSPYLASLEEARRDIARKVFRELVIFAKEQRLKLAPTGPPEVDKFWQESEPGERIKKYASELLAFDGSAFPDDPAGMLAFIAYGEAELRHADSNSSRNPLYVARANFTRLFQDRWLRWYLTAIRDGHVRLTEYTEIVRSLLSVLYEMGAVVDDQHQSGIQQRALKESLSYYLIDDSLALANGLSLRAQAETFLNEMRILPFSP